MQETCTNKGFQVTAVLSCSTRDAFFKKSSGKSRANYQELDIHEAAELAKEITERILFAYHSKKYTEDRVVVLLNSELLRIIPRLRDHSLESVSYFIGNAHAMLLQHGYYNIMEKFAETVILHRNSYLAWCPTQCDGNNFRVSDSDMSRQDMFVK